MSELEGKVAAILNERELIINRGLRAGVKPDMKFAVIWQREVKDPDTGEALGTLEMEKVRVKAVHVQDRITVARTYQVTSSTLDTWREAILGLQVSTVRTLRYDPRRAFGELSESESYVKVGDTVRQIEEDSQGQDAPRE